MPIRIFLRAVAGVVLTALAVAAQPNEWIKIEANPSKGFHWPYYLALYNPPASETVLLVIPNNSGHPSDEATFHDEMARSDLSFYSGFVSQLKAPALSPVFPRPAKYPEIDNIQALDRPALLTRIAGLERIDLQLIAMVEDARNRLAARGIVIDRKIWMMGGSASGSFISRFIALHPELVKAASIMSPGYGPTLPVAEWKGKRLDYPLGVADLDQLSGSSFNLEAYRQVPQFIWVGDEDRNWMKGYLDELASPKPESPIPLIAELFGGPENYIRWPVYETVFSSVGSMARLTVFPGFGHGAMPTLMRGLWLWDIFSMNQGAEPKIFSKPGTHELYFPYIASEDSGKTEVTIVNHDPRLTLNGQVQSFIIDTTSNPERLNLSVPPLGQARFTIGEAFRMLDGIGYFVVTSDSGFMGAYSTYSSKGKRFSIAACRPARRGDLPRLAGEGWGRLALISGDNDQVKVRLSALNDDGKEVARRDLTFPEGRRGRGSIIGSLEEIFGAGINSATHIRYSSDQLVVAFLLVGSSDGGLTDGVSALPDSIRW